MEGLKKTWRQERLCLGTNVAWYAIERTCNRTIAAMVSESPPIETALRMASSKDVDSMNASNACGTEP